MSYYHYVHYFSCVAPENFILALGAVIKSAKTNWIRPILISVNRMFYPKDKFIVHCNVTKIIHLDSCERHWSLPCLTNKCPQNIAIKCGQWHGLTWSGLVSGRLQSMEKQVCP